VPARWARVGRREEHGVDFGFYLPCYWPDTSYPAQHMYRETVEEARHAEDLGFVSVSIPEHHFINYLTHPSPLLTAVRVAAETKRIPIITACLVLPFYDIRRLAGEIAQADCLTNGRIELGLGRGAFQYEFDQFNVPMAESREKFGDSLAVLKKLLAEEEVSWDSKYYKFGPITVTPRPMSKPYPPIWIAALAPASINWCVKQGYHIMTTPLRDPFEAARQQAGAFFNAVAEAGPAARALKLSMLRMCYVSNDRRDIEEKIAMALENHRRFVRVYNTPGKVERGAIVPMDVDITPEEAENALVIGTPEECAAKLKTYETLEIHNMQLNMNFGASHRDVMRSQELFATRVMPHFA
jgi:alkanesulfonate monooxygenase SsuD/methylene tetrahydromethanopterin reductase-like flavin-dependent oxidoreductase (luciferase family)